MVSGRRVGGHESVQPTQHKEVEKIRGTEGEGAEYEAVRIKKINGCSRGQAGNDGNNTKGTRLESGGCFL